MPKVRAGFSGPRCAGEGRVEAGMPLGGSGEQRELRLFAMPERGVALAIRHGIDL
jgi:hypothetical protein